MATRQPGMCVDVVNGVYRPHRLASRRATSSKCSQGLRGAHRRCSGAPRDFVLAEDRDRVLIEFDHPHLVGLGVLEDRLAVVSDQAAPDGQQPEIRSTCYLGQYEALVGGCGLDPPTGQPSRSSTVDWVGMRLGMNWDPTRHLMPIGDDLWLIFAQVITLHGWL